jgi:hypothetical protein
MKPGESVIHKPSGRRLTVKRADGGNGMVLCSWMEKKADGIFIECSAAYSWEELRYPTEDEKAGVFAGIPEPSEVPVAVEGVPPAEPPVEPPPVETAPPEPKPTKKK